MCSVMQLMSHSFLILMQDGGKIVTWTLENLARTGESFSKQW